MPDTHKRATNKVDRKLRVLAESTELDNSYRIELEEKYFSYPTNYPLSFKSIRTQ